MNKRLGGSFAPPITTEVCGSYRTLATSIEDPQAKQYMLDLCSMVEKFNETPASSLAGSQHPSGVGSVVPLEKAEVERIWEVVPWSQECDIMGQCFDGLTGPVRNAAYHLLWYARELTMDREPITTDKL